MLLTWFNIWISWQPCRSYERQTFVI